MEKTRALYHQVQQVCEPIRLRPESALTCLQLVQLMMDQYHGRATGAPGLPSAPGSRDRDPPTL